MWAELWIGYGGAIDVISAQILLGAAHILQLLSVHICPDHTIYTNYIYSDENRQLSLIKIRTDRRSRRQTEQQILTGVD